MFSGADGMGHGLDYGHGITHAGPMSWGHAHDHGGFANAVDHDIHANIIHGSEDFLHHGDLAYPTHFDSGAFHLHEPASPLLHPMGHPFQSPYHGDLVHPTHFDSGHITYTSTAILFFYQIITRLECSQIPAS